MFKLAALITQVVSHGYFICFPPKCEGCCKVGSEFAQAEAKRNGGAKKKKEECWVKKKIPVPTLSAGARIYFLHEERPRGREQRSSVPRQQVAQLYLRVLSLHARIRRCSAVSRLSRVIVSPSLSAAPPLSTFFFFFLSFSFSCLSFRYARRDLDRFQDRSLCRCHDDPLKRPRLALRRLSRASGMRPGRSGLCSCLSFDLRRVVLIFVAC